MLNKTQISNIRIEDYGIKHKSMIDNSEDLIELSNNFAKLKEEYKKLA